MTHLIAPVRTTVSGVEKAGAKEPKIHKKEKVSKDIFF